MINVLHAEFCRVADIQFTERIAVKDAEYRPCRTSTVNVVIGFHKYRLPRELGLLKGTKSSASAPGILVMPHTCIGASWLI